MLQRRGAIPSLSEDWQKQNNAKIRNHLLQEPEWLMLMFPNNPLDQEDPATRLLGGERKRCPRGGAYKCRVEHMPSVIQQQASRYDSPRGKSAFSEQVVQPAGTSLPRVHDGLYDFRTTEPNLECSQSRRSLHRQQSFVVDIPLKDGRPTFFASSQTSIHPM